MPGRFGAPPGALLAAENQQITDTEAVGRKSRSSECSYTMSKCRMFHRRMWKHLQIRGWRWWHRFRSRPTGGCRTSPKLWSSQKRSPVYRFLEGTRLTLSTPEDLYSYASGRELTAQTSKLCQRWVRDGASRTQHLADVGLNVDILEVLVGVSVKQAQSGIQSDGHPDAVSHPGQLPHLALFARMSVEGLLLRVTDADGVT